MARRTRITTWYARQFGRLIEFGSERSRVVARTVNYLTAVDVSGRNIWLWCRFNQGEVVLLTLTTEPPIPVDSLTGLSAH